MIFLRKKQFFSLLLLASALRMPAEGHEPLEKQLSLGQRIKKTATGAIKRVDDFLCSQEGLYTIGALGFLVLADSIMSSGAGNSTNAAVISSSIASAPRISATSSAPGQQPMELTPRARQLPVDSIMSSDASNPTAISSYPALTPHASVTRSAPDQQPTGLTPRARQLQREASRRVLNLAFEKHCWTTIYHHGYHQIRPTTLGWGKENPRYGAVNTIQKFPDMIMQFADKDYIPLAHGQ